MAMSRSVGGAPKAGKVEYELSDWSVHYPQVYSHLVEEVWDDGGKRVTSTLLLLAEDGWIKGCLNDRDAKRTAWVAGRSVEAVLDAFEKKLTDGGMEWRMAPSGKNSHR